MKLRIRSLESRETLKIEIPSPSSLQDLKQVIAEKISFSLESLHLSLNRKNEIIASPIDTLNTLGIASGDLIYYTRHANVFESETPIQNPVPRVENQPIEVSNPEETLETMNAIDGKMETLDASIVPQVPKTLETMNTSDGKIETLDPLIVPQVPETLEIHESTEVKPVDTCEEIDTEAENLGDSISSAPGFLQKVYKAEVGNINNNEHKMLISAVHAVLLEFGFVCVDSITGKKINGYHLPEGWDLKTSIMSVKYTLPALVRHGEEVVETVILKFNPMGKFVSVYGSLSFKESISLKLNASRFVPSINYLCGSNCVLTGGKSLIVGAKSVYERKVFELWKTVKDRLAIPLSIDLCVKTGLELPPCFMRLPTEVKMKIFELLPGIDILKVGSLSSELRYLSSNDDLWKQKCVEEFSFSKSSGGPQSDWKKKYINVKKTTMGSRRSISQPRRPIFQPYPWLPNRRQSRPIPVPHFPVISGGESDLYPLGYRSYF
ncbi:hypothetical protein AQUCO_01700108v1 [Aquilegia coerulea]|uniref:F-box domain-containing protein n=1 Tax=Aquilegia coerulea TaxID=218851 RepID=A0A2G5DLB3_AQUCA|nr:hypothetical protein AQUCO_01700108v1 [Aquilegia coerulea]